MDRRDSILKYITKEQSGIEIGPWFGPLAPKREGYQCLTLDVFDTAELKRRGREEASLSEAEVDKIQDVDLLGSSTHIDKLVEVHGALGTFDYIVSSHNFEHLPNPIRFLQGCARVLKPNGIISMAIPDRRACFDYFRPVTKLAEWIEASLDDRSQPTFAQEFDFATAFASYDDDGKKTSSFHARVDPEKVSAMFNLERVFKGWMASREANDTSYHDAHCSVFTPSSFELLIRDCAYLGLAPYEIVEISESAGNEFYAHLRVTQDAEKLHPADYEETRNTILRRILNEAAVTSAVSINAADLDAMQQSQRRERDKLRTELEAAHAKVEQLEAMLGQIQSSSSWRLTGPLRKVVTALRLRN